MFSFLKFWFCKNHSKAFEICLGTQQCRVISIFLVFASAKQNAKAIEFWGIMKTVFIE